MGPLELQLSRELAIQMVRLCAQETHWDGDRQPMDLQTYRQWFDATFDKWVGAPRAELNGQTPGEAILGERRQLVGQSTPEPDSLQYVELYTDLPEPEKATADAFDQSSLGNLLTTEPDPTRDSTRPGPDPELAGHRSGTDETRWRTFCDRFLADWLDT